ncbi:MAG: DUF692 family protein [Bryobacteraceae bacterium]
MTFCSSSRTSFSSESSPAPKLGVGLLFNPVLPEFVEAEADSFDYLEIIPDREWADRGVNASDRYSVNTQSLDLFRRVRERKPLLCHSVGLSIGSAALFDTGHVSQIRRLHEDLEFAWHSDHLSFSRLPADSPLAAGQEMHTAISLPVPYDEDMLAMLSERVRRVVSEVPCTFLLENNVHYIETLEQDMDEPEFLNRLASESGCGILLDLHNVYVNARNHGFRPEDFLGEIDLSHVVEIHIAGGSALMGMYTDSHAGPVAEPVWGLLEDTLRAAPSIRGVTFEFHESYYPLLKTEGIREELSRARRAWERCG